MPKVKSPTLESFAKIKVVGIGGAGGTILARMNRNQMRGVELIALNTDVQDLHKTGVRNKIHIGKNISKGLGAGMDPEIGRQAAEESRAQIEEALKGADMIFLAAGMGGGTGTGAISVVAEIARNLGILTVSVVTKPFLFEGSRRMEIAEEGLAKLQGQVDSYIIIPNDRIFNIIEKDTTLQAAFLAIDEILTQSVRGLADLINKPGIINTDFADIKAVLKDAGMAIIGIGVSEGEDRAVDALQKAVNSPLFEISPQGARGILLSFSGKDGDLKMVEINEAAKMIGEMVDPHAKIIPGISEDSKIKKGEIRVLIVAAGFSGYKSVEKQQTFLGDSNGDNNGGHPSISISDDGNNNKDDSLDIPAFLRKKK